MSQAKFEICEICGKHGHMIGADGFVGPEFCDQAVGLFMLKEGVRLQCFTPREDFEMSDALAKSGLPLTTREAGVDYAWKIHCFNEFRIWFTEATQCYVLLDAHRFLWRGEGEYPPVPADFLEITEARVRSAIQ